MKTIKYGHFNNGASLERYIRFKATGEKQPVSGWKKSNKRFPV